MPRVPAKANAFSSWSPVKVSPVETYLPYIPWVPVYISAVNSYRMFQWERSSREANLMFERFFSKFFRLEKCQTVLWWENAWIPVKVSGAVRVLRKVPALVTINLMRLKQRKNSSIPKSESFARQQVCKLDMLLSAETSKIIKGEQKYTTSSTKVLPVKWNDWFVPKSIKLDRKSHVECSDVHSPNHAEASLLASELNKWS